MRVPRSFYKLRHLLMCTAAIGVVCGAGVLWMRRLAFLELAEAHASRVYDYGVNRDAGCWKDEFFDEENGIGPRRYKKQFVAHLDASVDHFAALERKYRYAASHPWLDVEPDPPCPE